VTVRLNPYLRFRDNAHEAMTFYHSVLGGDRYVPTLSLSMTEEPN